jgi:3D-(3,5/4)-trihydroxycyclohexane-1,2-dione acylhydrolase (decyclizing)
VQEQVKLIIVLIDNHGYASIGSLSRSLGSAGFGTPLRSRNRATHQVDGEIIPVDYVANAASLGAHAVKANGLAELKQALAQARKLDRTSVIAVETDSDTRVPGYAAWWDVAVAEVSDNEAVRRAREQYQEAREKERYYL